MTKSERVEKLMERGRDAAVRKAMEIAAAAGATTPGEVFYQGFCYGIEACAELLVDLSMQQNHDKWRKAVDGE